MFSNSLLGQSGNTNYISERLIKTPILNKSQINTLSPAQQNFKVNYYDKFGRMTQSVIANGSNTVTKDLVNYFQYDIHNRLFRKYLPLPATYTNAGDYKNNIYQEVTNFYSINSSNYASTYYPYAETFYDTVADDRVLATGSFGESWQINTGHTLRNNFAPNLTGEVLMWITDNGDNFPALSGKHGLEYAVTNPSITKGAYASYSYEGNTLKKVVTFDANNHVSIQFYNSLGKLLASKQLVDTSVTIDKETTIHSGNETAFNTTYYIYDNKNQLVYVLPPNAIKFLLNGVNVISPSFSGVSFEEQSLNEMIYCYSYDFQGRRVGIKVPGKGWEVTIYNKADQPVLIQNETLREANKWQFIKYDYLGRAIMTGLYTNGGNTAESLYNFIKYQNNAYESITSTNTNFYYTNNSFPTTNLEILTVNYFDTYVPTANAFDATLFSVVPNTTAIMGLATGALVKVLGSNPAQYLASTIYYDEYNRPIQTHKEQYGSAITWDKINNTYAFDGSLTKSVRYHTGAQNLTLQYRYDYDHAGRKTKTYLKANADPEVVHSDLQYNEVGQLIEKNIHGTGTAPSYTYLQSIDYRYTENGWLSSINNSKLDNSVGNNDLNDAFGMELFYDTPPNSLPINGGISGQSVNAQYNGNISASIWKAKDLNASAAKVNRQAYSYKYDILDRLQSARYSAETSANNGIYTKDLDRYNEALKYDNMGNIITLKRKGRNNVLIDNLTFDYTDGPLTTNKLYKINDAAINDANFNDFKDLTGGTVNKYDYDNDGRLIEDLTKKVNYAYNHLDLPTTITNTINGATLNFIYDASGRKLARTIPGSSTIHYYMDGIESEFVPSVVPNSSLLLLNSTSSNSTSTAPLAPTANSTATASGTYDIKFAATEEGRLRPKTVAANTYFFDYYLKDHLGNIRVTLTNELPIVTYPVCSVEDRVTTGPTYNNHIQHERLFYTIPPSRIGTIASGTFDYNNPTLSSPPTVAQKNLINKKCIQLPNPSTVNNANDSTRIWIPKILKVNSGDKISATINAFYNNTNITSPALGNGFFGTFVNTMVNQVPAGIPSSDIIAKLQSNFSSGANVYSGTVNSIYNNTYNGTTGYATVTRPKAYLLMLFYDNDFTLLKDQSYIREIQTNANTKDVMTLTDKIANVAGYCQIAIANESNYIVLFDKFQVTHKQSNTSEINEYYPFGLQNQQTSSTQFGSKEQRYKYNGKELMKDFGLESEDYGARLYSPQIGRWTVIDEKAEKYITMSPYNYAGNNPIKYIDPNGKELLVAGTEAQIRVMQFLTKAFGQNALNFCFDDKNMLRYEGDVNVFTGTEAIVFNGLNDVIKSEQLTEVKFQKDKFTDKKGGEYTATINDKKDRKQNTIFIDPVEIFEITKTFLQTEYKDNNGGTTLNINNAVLDNRGNPMQAGYRESSYSEKFSQAARFFHGIGHVLFQKNSQQESVIKYDNQARSIFKKQALSGKFKLRPEDPRNIDLDHTNRSD